MFYILYRLKLWRLYMAIHYMAYKCIYMENEILIVIIASNTITV